MSTRMRLSPEQAESWQAKVLEETGGRSRPLGLAVIAALGYNRKGKYPIVSEKAYIDLSGKLIALYKANRFANAQAFVFGSVSGFNDDLRRVADKCKLTDPDRIAFFEKMRSWIVKDERTTQVTGKLMGPDGKPLS